MGVRKKEVGLIVGLIILIVLAIFFGRYVGYAIQTTFSQVSIDEGIKVYVDEFDGSTYDFLRTNDSSLEVIENMTLEVESYGKIVFGETINLTEDAVGNVIDLDSGVEISDNSIDVNTTALSSLEKSATIYLYGSTFSDPRVLRDGEVCSDLICSEVSYSGGIFVFTITQLDSFVYSSGETPVVPSVVPSGGSSGGGGGGVTVRKSEFILDNDLIKISIKQGESQRKVIEIFNTGDTDLNFELELEGINKFIVISEDSFTLESKKVKAINVDIFAKENEVPDAYVGRIFVKGDGTIKVINVIIEVKDLRPLFDIRTEVVDKRLGIGKIVEGNIDIINMGDLQNFDVLVYYSIKNFNNEILLFREESLAIGRELNIVRQFEITDNFPFDDYVFYSRVSYEDISAASVDTFSVEKPVLDKLRGFIYFREILIALLLLLIIVILVMGYLIYRKLSIWSFFRRQQEKFNTK